MYNNWENIVIAMAKNSAENAAKDSGEVPATEEENFDHDPNQFDFVRKRKAFLK